MSQQMAMMVFRIKMEGIDIFLSSLGCIEFDALETHQTVQRASEGVFFDQDTSTNS